MWVVFYFFLFTNGSAFSEPMENSKSSKFAVSALLGIAAPLGTLGGSVIYMPDADWQFELGVGKSILADTNIAANVYWILNTSASERHLFYSGYNLSLEEKNESSQRAALLIGSNPGIGKSADKPYDNTTSAYKGHWANVGWGMEFGSSQFCYSFLLGLGLGGIEKTTGGEVVLRDGKYYRKKNGYRTDVAMLTRMPVRLVFKL